MKIEYRTILILMVILVLSLTGCSEHSYFEDQGLIETADEKTDPVRETGGKDADGPETAKEDSEENRSQTEEVTDDAKHLEQDGSQNVFVDLQGAVNHPGVYEVPYGSRLFQVIEMAGGLTEQADLKGVNRAAEVRDGEKIYICSAGEERPDSGNGDGSRTSEMTGGTADGNSGMVSAYLPDGRLDLNSATKEQLLTLPGIGEQKAEAILAYRIEKGTFSSPEEIKQIPGIKDGVYRKIQDQVGVR